MTAIAITETTRINGDWTIYFDEWVIEEIKGKMKIGRIKWKQKYNIPECLGYNEDSSKKKVIGMSGYT